MQTVHPKKTHAHKRVGNDRTRPHGNYKRANRQKRKEGKRLMRQNVRRNNSGGGGERQTNKWLSRRTQRVHGGLSGNKAGILGSLGSRTQLEIGCGEPAAA